MKYLHQYIDDPWELIAHDEALLDWAESQNPGHGVLATWESEKYFVVPGFSNRIQTEIFVDRCHQDDVPVIRRISGGGTVVQGPGCLNYSIILPIDSEKQLSTVTSTNEFMMKKLALALRDAFGQEIKINGITDLVFQNKKFSGNAQRRKRNTILFHGTLLHSFRLELISRYLKFPAITPEYRENKSHNEFVHNFPASPEKLIHILKETWQAHESLSSDIWKNCHKKAKELARQKYRMEEWNYRVN